MMGDLYQASLPNQKVVEKLAVFDVDGTQFKSACVYKAIDEAIRQEIFNPEAFAEAKARRHLWQADYNEGVYQSFLHHMVGGFTASIAGVKVKDFQAITDQKVPEYCVRTFHYTRRLAQILTPSHRLITISGSPLLVVEPFLNSFGFDQVIASTCETKDGYFTKEVMGVNKKLALERVAGKGKRISVGIGDTAGDIPVLSRSTCPIAFNPSTTLRCKAIEVNWLLEQKREVTQLLPGDDGYQVSFDRSPSIILERAGIGI